MFTLNPLRMKLPVKLVLLIGAVLLFGDYLSLNVKEVCYATSLTIKAVLTFMLPFIIFSYLSSCLLSFKKGVISFVIILLTTVFISNFLSTQVGFAAGLSASKYIHAAQGLAGNDFTKILIPTWDFTLHPLISNQLALLLGLGGGIVVSMLRNLAESKKLRTLILITKRFETFTEILKKLSTFFLMKMFIPAVPLFILGYILKLQYDGALGQIISSYAPVFILTAIVQFSYVIFLFGIVNKFNPSRWYNQVRNTVPAVITGLTTISSAAALPLTLQAAERNTQNPNMSRVIVTSTVNIHMIGNLIAVPILAVITMANFGIPYPGIETFIICGLGCALAQFAAAGVPGGGVLVMLPLLEQYLGFTGEMSSMLTALYLFFDTLIAGSNTIGGVWLAVALNKLYKKLNIVAH